MKITRTIKKELWRLFDQGHLVKAITIDGKKLDEDAVEKQHTLWKIFRTRNPNRKTHATKTDRTLCGKV